MVVVNIVKETLLTRYVRFLPISWYGHVCMRVEVYGCEGYTGKTNLSQTYYIYKMGYLWKNQFVHSH